MADHWGGFGGGTPLTLWACQPQPQPQPQPHSQPDHSHLSPRRSHQPVPPPVPTRCIWRRGSCHRSMALSSCWPSSDSPCSVLPRRGCSSPPIPQTPQALGPIGPRSIAPQPQSPVQPVGLMVRGQPMRWSQAESQAVQERAAGEPYDSNEYKAAMKAAQFNQKNGWSDDGTERLGSGTPLRNNQKRGGDSNDDPCLASFTLTAGICDDGGEDGFWRGR